MFKLPRTKQRVFNKVVRHLLTQNKASVMGVVCRYRGRDGLMCAAGCLIPDENYDKSMESTSWVELIKNGEVPSNHKDLIYSLQRVHDMFGVEEWPEKLNEIAKKYNLDPSYVEKYRKDKS
jgi:hypothetical protein